MTVFRRGLAAIALATTVLVGAAGPSGALVSEQIEEPPAQCSTRFAWSAATCGVSQYGSSSTSQP